jgi:hypothetical protein
LILGQIDRLFGSNGLVHQGDGWTERLSQLTAFVACPQMALDRLVVRSAGRERAAREHLEHLVAID